ncbi:MULTISPECIES: hypothetical protein [unclassified Peribacillus]|nr:MULTISPECIES: hypothetical protein [unclassified Peribacillus]MBK5446398.1 hypothetical protein [Peribacillus sp. TH24]MBK5458892.1 hypothetical protein [Peribacillus sp. TH27]
MEKTRRDFHWINPNEIVGTIVRLIPYTGFPRVLNGPKAVKTFLLKEMK